MASTDRPTEDLKTRLSSLFDKIEEIRGFL
jgi:hypothetical protein